MSEDVVRTLLNALQAPSVLIGPSERIEVMNAAAIRLFGADGTSRHYITALRQPAVLDAIEDALRLGQGRMARYLGREGRRDTTWRVVAAPVALDEGAPSALVTFEDITDVEAAEQSRRDFVANVSHELRTPLTSLLGFVETLNGPARDDAAARDRFLGIMAKEARRMEQLVADLLSLSRVEQEERIRPTQAVDLKELCREVLASLEPTARKAEVRLEADLPDSDVVVAGDRAQLRQVLSNLIENAIKYGGKGPVEVRLSAPGVEPALRTIGVTLTVADHGEGIAAHHLPRLTERFYRVDSHRSREVGGTGLGLAIVKHIVNRHRGRLRVESEIGKGSQFSVVLPLS
jgi:two-component system phosphate regulon sensor histidine kinase PhoR